jgi:hypothetical protein
LVGHCGKFGPTYQSKESKAMKVSEVGKYWCPMARIVEDSKGRAATNVGSSCIGEACAMWRFYKNRDNGFCGFGPAPGGDISA